LRARFFIAGDALGAFESIDRQLDYGAVGGVVIGGSSLGPFCSLPSRGIAKFRSNWKQTANATNLTLLQKH